MTLFEHVKTFEKSLQSDQTLAKLNFLEYTVPLDSVAGKQMRQFVGVRSGGRSLGLPFVIKQGPRCTGFFALRAGLVKASCTRRWEVTLLSRARP